MTHGASASCVLSSYIKHTAYITVLDTTSEGKHMDKLNIIKHMDKLNIIKHMDNQNIIKPIP